jgi:hypothetical protein
MSGLAVFEHIDSGITAQLRLADMEQRSAIHKRRDRGAAEQDPIGIGFPLTIDIDTVALILGEGQNDRSASLVGACQVGLSLGEVEGLPGSLDPQVRTLPLASQGCGAPLLSSAATAPKTPQRLDHRAGCLDRPGAWLDPSGVLPKGQAARLQGSAVRIQGPAARLQGAAVRLQGSAVRSWPPAGRLQGNTMATSRKTLLAHAISHRGRALDWRPRRARPHGPKVR